VKQGLDTVSAVAIDVGRVGPEGLDGHLHPSGEFYGVGREGLPGSPGRPVVILDLVRSRMC
jgi:hypothetical protein